jgi:predicted  nucleic acid-binding Zn-ribbon protein
MRLRERLRLLLQKFEHALTRVEDQGVRIESGVDNIQDLMVKLSESISTLRSDVTERHSRLEVDINGLKKRMGVLEKKLGGGQALPH